MHHLDLGLFHYQIVYTRSLLQAKCKPGVLNEFDIRLGQIPRFSGLKIFKNGLENVKRFTADEYRNMMKVMIFVVDGLFFKYRNQSMTEAMARRLDKALVDVYVNWNNMYMISRQSTFSESDLQDFQVSLFIYDFDKSSALLLTFDQTTIVIWAEGFLKLFMQYSPSNLRLPKLHSWYYHAIPAIYEFGCINGYTTETYEYLHKNWVKNPYRLSNKRNATEQMLNTVSSETCLVIIGALYSNIMRCHNSRLAVSL